MDVRNKILFEPPEMGCVLSLMGLPGGGSTIYDSSPYGNQGTIMGATWGRTLGGLWCLSFDGSDDYASIPYNASLDITEQLTLEMWVKRGTWPDETSWNAFIGRNANRAYQIRRSGSSNSLTFDLMVDGVLKQCSSPSAFPTDTWWYIACTFDGTAMRFYVNAGTPATLNAPGMIDTTTQPLYVGAQDVGLRFINGTIALPRIHNRALMALEIGNHFEREKHLFGVW